MFPQTKIKPSKKKGIKSFDDKVLDEQQPLTDGGFADQTELFELFLEQFSKWGADGKQEEQNKICHA
jgi:hypothetical protein